MNLAIATCHGQPDLWFDDAGLPVALAAHGIDAVPRPWQDLGVEDGPLLVRTPWDYAATPDAFRVWLEALDAAGTHVINPARRMLWNLDKRYLLELEAAGHAIVPTHLLDTFTPNGAQAVGLRHGWPKVVCKPTVGCAAEGLVVVDTATGRVTEFDATGNTWRADTPRRPVGPCLAQPLIEEVVRTGEWSLFYFGGTFSHAILKAPKMGDIRVQEEHGGRTARGEPPAVAVGACDALAAQLADCTYVRVDGVVVGDQFLLMEVELIEPELYFRYAPGALDRFAAAVAEQLASSRG